MSKRFLSARTQIFGIILQLSSSIVRVAGDGLISWAWLLTGTALPSITRMVSLWVLVTPIRAIITIFGTQAWTVYTRWGAIIDLIADSHLLYMTGNPASLVSSRKLYIAQFRWSLVNCVDMQKNRVLLLAFFTKESLYGLARSTIA